MRVTNRSIEQTLIGQLRDGYSELARMQSLVATGIRVSKPSDDPIAASQILRVEHSLRNLEQFQRNSGAAQIRITTQESVLSQLGDLITRAQEVALSQGSSTLNDTSRLAAAGEIDALLNQVFQFGNTRVGNEFVFGGGATDTPPFVAGAYVGDDTVRQVRISDDVVVDTNLTGRQLFVDSDVIRSLTSLRDALQSGSATAVQDSVGGLNTAFDQVQRHLAATGAATRQLESLSLTRENMEFDLTTARAELREIPFEEATTRFLSAQTALEAARAAASRILNNTLTDFLR